MQIKANTCLNIERRRSGGGVGGEAREKCECVHTNYLHISIHTHMYKQTLACKEPHAACVHIFPRALVCLLCCTDYLKRWGVDLQMASNSSKKSKSSSGLRVLWIPGRKSHPKGRLSSTNKQISYSPTQKRSEVWTLGGSKAQAELYDLWV